MVSRCILREAGQFQGTQRHPHQADRAFTVSSVPLLGTFQGMLAVCTLPAARAGAIAGISAAPTRASVGAGAGAAPPAGLV